MTWQCRSGDVNDYPAIRDMALQAFPEATLLPPECFDNLLSRRPALVRILETNESNSSSGPCGYYALWPMTLRTFSSLVRQQVSECELCAGSLVDLTNARCEVLYVMDICVVARCGPRAGAHLARDLFDRLGQNLSAAPQVRLVAAWAFNDVGERLSRAAGMGPCNSGASGPRLWAGRRARVLAALRRDVRIK
jgi:hypothetical protein